MNQTPTTRTVYSARVTNWPLIAVTIVFAVALAAFAGTSTGSWPGALLPLAFVVLVLVLVVVTTSSVRTTAGDTGVRIRFGLLGWPRFAYAIEEIQLAEALDISIWSMGGWGIHWSPWRGLRLLLRSGPALRLTLTDGRKVTVSVTDPATAVTALGRRVSAPAKAG